MSLVTKERNITCKKIAISLVHLKSLSLNNFAKKGFMKVTKSYQENNYVIRNCADLFLVTQ